MERNIPRIKAKKRVLPDMRVSSFGDLIEADFDNQVDLVKNLVPLVSCGFLAGLPKCGKTWGVLDLALAALTGQKFLGRDTTKLDRPVLYLAGEGGASKLRQRLLWLAKGRGIAPKELRNTLYLALTPHILLDRSDGMAALEEEIKRLDPGLVIIDPLTRFHTADENSRTQIDAPILTPLRQISEEYELCIMVVHHSPKWGGGHFDPLRGTSSFHGWYDFLLYYEPIESGSKNGKDQDDRGEEISGYSFSARLRDYEEPPSRKITLDVDSVTEFAKVSLSYSEQSVSLPGSGHLAEKVLATLQYENVSTLSKLRKIHGRRGDQMKRALDKLIDEHKIEQITEDQVIKYVYIG
jgi:RecA-family ATPase